MNGLRKRKKFDFLRLRTRLIHRSVRSFVQSVGRGVLLFIGNGSVHQSFENSSEKFSKVEPAIRFHPNCQA